MNAMIIRLMLLVPALLPATAFAAGLIAGETAATVTVREADGRTVTLRKHPHRVVIAYGSLVGIWYEAGGTAVGIPTILTSETLPEAARQVEKIGSIGSPNPERVLMLKPDLVLLSGRLDSHHRLREILDRSRIENVILSYENYTDFVGLLDLFARLNDNRGEGKAEAARVDQAVGTVLKGTRPGGGPRFLSLMASAKAVMAETSQSHTAHMAEMLGGRNIVSADGENAPLRVRLSLERIVMADPDVIFIILMGHSDKVRRKLEKDLTSDVVWGSLRAVRSGRVHILPTGLFLYRPNARFPEAFAMLKEKMYPREKQP